MKKLHVKKGDTVVVLSGKDKGKKGKVLEVSPRAVSYTHLDVYKRQLQQGACQPRGAHLDGRDVR